MRFSLFYISLNYNSSDLHLPSVHGLSLGRQDLLDVGLPLQVRPPAEVVSDQVEVVAALAPHYHYAFSVGLLADYLEDAINTDTEK